jgi:hypothetical protein
LGAQLARGEGAQAASPSAASRLTTDTGRSKKQSLSSHK